jgi:hypothetical protein
MNSNGSTSCASANARQPERSAARLCTRTQDLLTVQRKSLLRIDCLLTFEVGSVATPTPHGPKAALRTRCELFKMLTATIIVARVQPGTSKGITDLLLPQPSSVLKKCGGPSSLHFALFHPHDIQCLPKCLAHARTRWQRARKNTRNRPAQYERELPKRKNWKDHEATVRQKRRKKGNKRLRSRSLPSRFQGLHARSQARARASKRIRKTRARVQKKQAINL